MKLTFSIIAAAMLLALAGCKEPPVVVDIKDIQYKGYSPVNVEVDSSETDQPLVKTVKLHYPVMLGDTLDVTILEFKGDVYALDYYMNSGKFQGSVPILRGSFLEQSIRADQRIFIFRHDSFRRYERSDLENYVRSFPGYRGGFPQEFLSLPFEHREQGRTSIQTKFFLGVQSVFPMLVQSYRDGNLRWNVARSWELVESDDFESWIQQLDAVEPSGIAKDNDCVYFTVKGIDKNNTEARGIASRLPGGRVVVAWGYLDWFDLERKFFVASDRVYESSF